jgi:hypothetical protein
MHDDEREALVKKSFDAAVRVLEEWRQEASGIATVECSIQLPCHEVVEHPSGWRESATRKLSVEIRLKGAKSIRAVNERQG